MERLDPRHELLEAGRRYREMQRQLGELDGRLSRSARKLHQQGVGIEEMAELLRVPPQRVASLVSEQREARESDDRDWFPLVPYLPIAVLIETRERRVSKTNQAFCDLFGLNIEPDDLIGADCAAAIDDMSEMFADPDGFRIAVEEIVAQATPRADERIELADGRVFLRDFVTSRAANGDTRLVWLYRDVSKQERKADAMRAARDQALEVAEQRANLISLISHEIRTPLSGTVGLVDLLLSQPLPPDVHSIVTDIQQASANVTTLLENLLDLSRMDLDRLQLDIQEFAPCDLVESLLDTAGRAARAKHLFLTWTCEGLTPHAVRADPVRLRQVLSNLVDNAIKFTQQGEVAVLVHGAGDEVCIDVRDTGRGIPAAEMGELFEPFQQGSAARDAGSRGAGLGLALAKRLVELMGGRLTVESEPGLGTTFSVYLPKVSTAGHDHPAPVPLDGRRILLLAGDGISQEAIRRPLAVAGAQLVDSEQVADAVVALVSDRAAQSDLVERVEALCRGGIRSLILTADEDLFADRGVASRVALLPIRVGGLTALLQNGAAPEVAPVETPLSFSSASRVLVVDDSPANRKLIEALLKKLEVQVSLAESGRAAVQVLQDQAFDAVLMDVNMPEMDGLQATREIRNGEGEARIPIIALTASALPGDREKCLEAGMDDYIKKPVNLAGLRAALGKYLPDDSPDGDGAPSWSGPGNHRSYLDEERLQELSDEVGDPAIVRESLEIFLAALPGRVHDIGTLRDPVRRSDLEYARRVVHALKSPSAMLGARDLAQKCTLVEALASSGELIRKDAIEDILASAQGTGEEMRRYLARE